jgi:hypothetical protein
MSKRINFMLVGMLLLAGAAWTFQVKTYSNIGKDAVTAVQENTLVQCQGLVLSDKSAAKRICSKLEEELQ